MDVAHGIMLTLGCLFGMAAAITGTGALLCRFLDNNGSAPDD